MLNSEDNARLVEDARLKSEQDEQARLNAEDQTHLVEESRQEAKEHEHAQLKVEEGVRLALEERRREEEKDLSIKDKETRLKYKAAEQARLKAE